MIIIDPISMSAVGVVALVAIVVFLTARLSFYKGKFNISNR